MEQAGTQRDAKRRDGAAAADAAPLALHLEPGSELYAGMATVIIGGMLSSTFLSLLAVPCMYTYFDQFQHLLGRLVARRPGRARPPTADDWPVGASTD